MNPPVGAPTGFAADAVSVIGAIGNLWNTVTGAAPTASPAPAGSTSTAPSYIAPAPAPAPASPAKNQNMLLWALGGLLVFGAAYEAAKHGRAPAPARA